MNKKYPNKDIAINALREAEGLNKGKWVQHSEYVALACKNISGFCDDMDSNKAYILGLLHDIGRRVGVVQERHTIEGFKYCSNQGWDDVAKICITHSYSIKDIRSVIGKLDITKEDYDFIKKYIDSVIYDDYDLLIQLCDALALPTGFCLMEQRLVDVTRKYGINEYTVTRWNKLFEIKEYFQRKMNCSIYKVLPNVIENTFSQDKRQDMFNCTILM